MRSTEHGWPLLDSLNAKYVSEGWTCAGPRVCACVERKDAGGRGEGHETLRENPPVYILAQCSSWAKRDLAGESHVWLPGKVLICVFCVCVCEVVGGRTQVGTAKLYLYHMPHGLCLLGWPFSRSEAEVIIAKMNWRPEAWEPLDEMHMVVNALFRFERSSQF